jgi:hypothetical protein
MAYLGNTPTTQSFISGTDYFNGTGAQTAFTLTRTVASVNDIEAVVNNVVQQPNDAYNISGTTITFTSAPSAGTNNVYVRYLSTTTQAITPSQNTVSWNTLDSNVQGDLGISFKNRIINGNMVISQRNGTSSVTPTDGQYVLDRWIQLQAVASKYSVQQNAGSVTPPVGFTNYLGCTSLSAYTVGAGEYFMTTQRIEGYNIADLGFGTANAKTITVSFWVRSSLTGTFGGAITNVSNTRSYPFTYNISSANTWEKKSITITGDTSGSWSTSNTTGMQLKFGLGVGSSLSGTAGAWVGADIASATGAVSVVGTNGATFYITGVQLEVGTQATTFTLAGGSYGAELQLCQRYFEVHVCGGNNTGIMPMSTGSATSGRGTYVFKVQKRANPSSVTFLAANQYLYQGAGLNTAPSGIALAVASPSALLIDVTISGATTNATANLLENSTAGANMISISAEL